MAQRFIRLVEIAQTGAFFVIGGHTQQRCNDRMEGVDFV